SSTNTVYLVMESSTNTTNDHVDSMTELISDTFREDILAKAKPPATSSIAVAESQKVHRQNSSVTPDEDLIMKRAGSSASFSKNSGSGRKSVSGKGEISYDTDLVKLKDTPGSYRKFPQ
ncbi:unnamed protein product, partial [Candidula unifasciata]